MTNEQRTKLQGAKSLEEVKDILCVMEGDDQEFIEEAEQVWKELESHRNEGDAELDLDELEAVSGGADRDWVTDGCAATCEGDSWCMSNDFCFCSQVTYDRFNDRCNGNHDLVFTGTQLTHHITRIRYKIYKCNRCGRKIKIEESV